MTLQIGFHFIFPILLAFHTGFYYYKINDGVGREILFALSFFPKLNVSVYNLVYM